MNNVHDRSNQTDNSLPRNTSQIFGFYKSIILFPTILILILKNLLCSMCIKTVVTFFLLKWKYALNYLQIALMLPLNTTSWSIILLHLHFFTFKFKKICQYVRPHTHTHTHTHTYIYIYIYLVLIFWKFVSVYLYKTGKINWHVKIVIYKDL